MSESLLRQTITMEEHVHRTNLLEQELRPIKKHVLLIETAFKIIGASAIIVGMIEGILKLLN